MTGFFFAFLFLVLALTNPRAAIILVLAGIIAFVVLYPTVLFFAYI